MLSEVEAKVLLLTSTSLSLTKVLLRISCNSSFKNYFLYFAANVLGESLFKSC
jgi:hypothetical protein